MDIGDSGGGSCKGGIDGERYEQRRRQRRRLLTKATTMNVGFHFKDKLGGLLC